MNIIEQLRHSAEIIKKNRPSYNDILGFYGQVFEAQELSRQKKILPQIMIEPDYRSAKEYSAMPLMEMSQFQVDYDCAAKLLITICDLAQAFARDMSQYAQGIKKAIENHDLPPDQLFSAILKNQEQVLEQMGQSLCIPVPMLALFGYLAMAPGIEACASQFESCFDKDSHLNHGNCPVCGSLPDLAFLDKDGSQHLKCCFCSHQWAVRRMGCVFCGSQDFEKQHYFYSDDEKEYRVNLCDSCGSYIKVVDLRQMDRYFYPGLELISTLHLDLKAREKGYTGSTVFFSDF